MSGSMQFGSRAKLATFLVAAGALAVLVVLVLPKMASATQPNPDHKVTLCHATDSYNNPYVEITVDVASVLQGGHGGHDGPVFDPSLPKHAKWGDIIPSFDFGPDEQYAGMNLADGQSILDNGCAAPTTTTSTPGA